MRLQRIAHFIAIAEAGSIRSAARNLGMSQPALTRSLQQLEEELGVTLMRRGIRGAALTAAGSNFLARARVAHIELIRASEEARLSTKEATGQVTFGLSSVAASLLLPELIIGLQRQQPGMQIRIIESAPPNLLPMLRENGADLVVTRRSGNNLDAGLQYRPLFEVYMRVAARPGHPLAGLRDLRELSAATWCTNTSHGSPDNIVSLSFEAIGLPAPVPAVCSAGHPALIDLVAASDMLLALPPPRLRQCVVAGRLIEIPLTRPLVPLPIGLYTRADSLPTTAARAAMQAIAGIARRYAASGELCSREPITGG